MGARGLPNLFPPPRGDFTQLPCDLCALSAKTPAPALGGGRRWLHFGLRRFPPLGRPRRGCRTHRQQRQERVGGEWENKGAGGSFVFLLPLHHLRQLRRIPSGVSTRACRLGPALLFWKGNRFVRRISQMEICVQNKKSLKKVRHLCQKSLFFSHWALKDVFCFFLVVFGRNSGKSHIQRFESYKLKLSLIALWHD